MRGWAEALDEPTIVYVEACEDPAVDLTQREAVLDALGRLDLPIVVDLEIGHVPPHLPLVNGALAHVVVDGDRREITQHLR